MKRWTVLTLAAAVSLIFAANSASADALIYEPFDMDPGGLGGATPVGTGLTGTWNSGNVSVVSGSLSYGSLVTSGNHALATGSNYSKADADPGTTLTGAGLMADGATLWFSALAVSNGNPTGGDGNARTYIAIGNGTADGFDRIGPHTGGNGFAIKLNNGTAYAHGWKGPGAIGGTSVAVPDGVNLVVGKITWAAVGSNDTLELFLPGTDLVQGAAVSTLNYDFDQSTFDTVSFAGGHLANAVPEVDEIRFGATYADVTPVPEPATMGLLALSGLGILARRRRSGL